MRFTKNGCLYQILAKPNAFPEASFHFSPTLLIIRVVVQLVTCILWFAEKNTVALSSPLHPQPSCEREIPITAQDTRKQKEMAKERMDRQITSLEEVNSILEGMMYEQYSWALEPGGTPRRHLHIAALSPS